jgi:hypothetical protein
MEARRLRIRLRLLALVCLVSLLSCADNKSTVSGTVTFDGQPVLNGVVTFVKSEGDLIREGAIIKEGAFKATLPPGEYRIELSAQKVVGKRKQKGFDGKDEEVELTAELFPESYNSKTTLTKKIEPGSNMLQLDIKGTN